MSSRLATSATRTSFLCPRIDPKKGEGGREREEERIRNEMKLDLQCYYKGCPLCAIIQCILIYANP